MNKLLQGVWQKKQVGSTNIQDHSYSCLVNTSLSSPEKMTDNWKHNPTKNRRKHNMDSCRYRESVTQPFKSFNISSTSQSQNWYYIAQDPNTKILRNYILGKRKVLAQLFWQHSEEKVCWLKSGMQLIFCCCSRYNLICMCTAENKKNGYSVMSNSLRLQLPPLCNYS